MQLHNIYLHVAASIDASGGLHTPLPAPQLMRDVLQYNYAAGALSLPVAGPAGGQAMTNFERVQMYSQLGAQLLPRVL